MLKEEIRFLIRKVERELVTFVVFIKNIEKQHSKFYYRSAKQEHQDSSTNEPTHSNFSIDGENEANGSAIVDSFNLVKNILQKLCHLIDEFSSLPTEDDKNLINTNSYKEKFCYTQYVYQVSSYLITVVEESLKSFSEKLDRLASSKLQRGGRTSKTQTERTSREKIERIPKTQIKVQAYPKSKQRKKMTEPHLKFSFLRPATIYPDCKMHKQSDLRSYRYHFPKANSRDKDPSDEDTDPSDVDTDSSDVDSDPSDVDSDSSDENTESERSEYDNRNNLLYKSNFKVKDHRTNAVLNLLASSVCDLARAIEELSMQLKEIAFTSHTQTPFAPYLNKQPVSGQTFPGDKGIAECNCTSSCTECCEFCKKLNKMKVSKIPHRRQKLSSSGNKANPILTSEPFWMQSNPMNKFQQRGLPKFREIAVERNRESSDKTYHFNDPLKQFKKYIFDSFGGFDKDQKYNDEEFQEKSDKLIGNIEEIRPSHLRKRVSTGELKPKSSTVRKEKEKVQKLKQSPKREKPRNTLLDINKCISRGLETLRRHKSSDQKFTSQTPKDEYRSQKKNVQFIEDVEHDQDLTEPELNPVNIKDLEDSNFSEGKLGDEMSAFCLLPQVKNFFDNVNENEILVDKTGEEDEAYPQTIVFHLKKFSNVLKNKFEKHLKENSENTEEQESDVILDLIIDSLEEAIDMYDQTDDALTTPDEVETSSSEETLRKKRENDYDNKKKTDALLKDIYSIVTQISPSLIDTDLTKLNFKHRKILQEMCKTISQSNIKQHSYKGKDEENILDQVVSRACELCLNMIKPIVCDCQEEISEHCKEVCITKEILKESCFNCLNACEQGMAIHQCHESVPSNLMEIRHMDERGRICVCYLIWDRRREEDDWRWLKSPFQDLTRVEIQQETTAHKDTILKVIYAPEATMLKESLAETRLRVVDDFPGKLQLGSKPTVIKKSELKKCASTTHLSNMTEDDKKRDAKEALSIDQVDENLLTKIGRFFDDIQKVGYGKGPPLIIKLRKNSILYDAYDLLMVPSKIHLNYYRNLRVLFIGNEYTRVFPTYSNFINEDKCDKLFELLANELFVSSEKRLFEQPSEETECLYPNPDSSAHPQWFVFAGAILALAFFHQKKLDILLPVCLLKTLLERPVRLNDLEEIDPVLYKKLIWIKENDISNCKDKMTFTVKDKRENRVYMHELVRNGKNRTLTEKNKFEYIDFVVKWKLADRCLTQMKDFRSGFASVLQPCFLTMFSEKELQLLIKQPPENETIMEEGSSVKLPKEAKQVTRRNTE